MRKLLRSPTISALGIVGGTLFLLDAAAIRAPLYFGWARAHYVGNSRDLAGAGEPIGGLLAPTVAGLVCVGLGVYVLVNCARGK